MLFKPFKKLIEDFHKKKEQQEYEGVVEDNNDPKQLGRIRVRTDLWEDVDSDNLPWVYPEAPFFLGNSKNSIKWSVPEVGSQVKVYYPTNDKTMPCYKGMEFNTQNMCTFFKVDYPNTYGFKDSRGNFYIVNKATDISQYQHSSTTNIKIESDGTYTITTPDGSYFWSDPEGNMRACGKTFTMNMEDSITLNSKQININGLENVNTCSKQINENAESSINMTSKGTVNTKADGTVNSKSGSTTNITASPTTNVNSMLHVTGKGTFDSSVNVATTLTANSDCIGGGKSLKGHCHGNGNQGAPTTSPL